MRLHVSLKSGVPIYVQVVTQIKQLVATGRLPVGAELPTIRALAEQLLVNPNTIARAYRELEQEGVVTARRGLGTVISEAGSPMGRRERKELLQDRIDEFLVGIGQLGFEFDQVMELMRKRHAERAPERGETHDNE